MTSKDDIRDFLKRFKKTMIEDELELIPGSNIDTLAKAGISLLTLEEMILEITDEAYSIKVDEQNGRPVNAWTFYVPWQERYLNITLRLDGEKAKCTVLHSAKGDILGQSFSKGGKSEDRK